ncbi:MAG TPA: ribbon-helix-helix protein, CopG family [Methanomicrobia archaeon]|nr:ribbon-helix-helix protein, CopG family [Methanomicrobia archaeon]HHF09805.1 ribbon-helix-helix protein, CopG family [Methanomicrobia archaeon]
MIQVQVRVPEEKIREIDRLVKKGVFKSRSDAIRTMIELYQERRKIREFYAMLRERSKEAEEHPEDLIPIEDV